MADLREVAERIVRDATPATDSGATCFVPRYQVNQLQEALAVPPPAPSYDALLLIVQSVAGALERAGVTDCDDPGEAIDVLRERAERDGTAVPVESLGRDVSLKTADDRILWGVVANAGRLSKKRKVRWGHVSDATGQGSNYSAELCRRFGFDPNEDVGGRQNG